MLLFTLVYSNYQGNLMDEITCMKEYFKKKDVIVGFSESIENGTHFIKVYCEDDKFDSKIEKLFKLYMSNILYEIMVEYFCNNEIQSFITDTYFFLKFDEIKEVKEIVSREIKIDSKLTNEDSIFLLNRKNDITKKIQQFLDENNELNIDGFLRFRIKEYMCDIQDMIDKIVEQYMSLKEYNEFINLLKYFVDIQESKIDLVNIIVDTEGNYIIKDKFGEDISDSFFSEINDIKATGEVTVEDMLISALITNVPSQIVVHCVENAINKEIFQTIKNVFENRVSFCNNCSVCRKYTQST